MAIHVFVVSHNHGKQICQIGALKKLASCDDVNVFIKNNYPDEVLSAYAKNNNLNMINESHGLGFGANNNYLFRWLYNRKTFNEADYVVIMNPDVDISRENLLALIRKMDENNDKLSTVNLFKDYAHQIHDNSIRRWPGLYDFFSAYLGGENRTVIDKARIKKPTFVDWCAGSFLVFKASLYRQLNGFDERFFMYCEDIDVCYRARKLGVKVRYYPEICAVHHAAHASRHFLSKHFFWHVTSALRYLLITKR